MGISRLRGRSGRILRKISVPDDPFLWRLLPPCPENLVRKIFCSKFGEFQDAVFSVPKIIVVGRPKAGLKARLKAGLMAGRWPAAGRPDGRPVGTAGRHFPRPLLALAESESIKSMNLINLITLITNTTNYFNTKPSKNRKKTFSFF